MDVDGAFEGVLEPGTERVAVGLLRRGNRVLLAHRTRERRWCPSSWDVPGGHLLPGEDAASALVRELAEELGVTVQRPHQPADLQRRWSTWGLDLWICESWSREPLNLAPHEHDDLAWVDREQVAAWELDGELAGPWVGEAVRAALGTSRPQGAPTRRPSTDAADTHASDLGRLHPGAMPLHTITDTPLGALTVVVHDSEGTDTGTLIGLYYPGHSPTPDPSGFGALVRPDHPGVAPVITALGAYLTGSSPRFDVPFAVAAGTTFQRAVWERVAAIGVGETRTYAQVAADVGHPSAHRAVGTALARNAVCLAVPCHRVVASGGRITGYAGGVERKRWLLAMEGSGSPPPALVIESAPPTQAPPTQAPPTQAPLTPGPLPPAGG